MKRLCLVSIITLLFLASCQSSNERYLRIADGLPIDERLRVYTEAIYSEGPSVELVYNLAYSYLIERKYEEALQVAREGSRFFPSELRFHMLSAYAERERGDLEGYIASLEFLLNVLPGDKDLMIMLMQASSEVSDQERANAIAFDILKINPEERSAIDQLAKSYPFFVSRMTDIRKEAEKVDLPLFVPPWEIPLLRLVNDIEIPLKGKYQYMSEESGRFMFMLEPMLNTIQQGLEVPLRFRGRR